MYVALAALGNCLQAACYAVHQLFGVEIISVLTVGSYLNSVYSVVQIASLLFTSSD